MHSKLVQNLGFGSPESVGMSHDRIQNLTSVLNKYVTLMS